MNDCPNAEIRDRLPDLLHERLDPEARAEVVAHVERCADCRAELALLRDAHALLVGSTRVDVARIVRALPKPGTVGRAAPVRSRRFDWRVAASIAALVIGGVSIGTYDSIGRDVHEATVAATAPVPKPRIAPLDSLIPQHGAAAAVASAAAGASTATGSTAVAGGSGTVTELATGDGLSDMSDSQLQALLADIDNMQALPPAEPDTVVVTAPAAGALEDN